MTTETRNPDPEVLVALNRAATAARLMAGAVHEVNNALQVISGSVELLEQQPDLAAPVVKSLDRIKRQSERAAAALAEVLAFTKAPLDGQERFNLRDVVTRAVGLRRYAAGRLGLSIEIEGESTSPDLATANAGYVQQAVLNLLVNAEQAMAASAPGAIRVSLPRTEDRIGVQVRDSGPGLATEVTEGRGRPFVSTKAPAEGAGLGLWTSEHIAQLFGGSLETVSDTTGTVATLWLPRG